MSRHLKRVLFLFPTAWDAQQLAVCESAGFEAVFASPSDEDCPARLDVGRYVAELAREHRGRIGGVLTSSDYPGPIVAALLARELELPGPDVRAVVRASHKYYARLAARRAAPEATPRFELVDPRDPRAPAFGFPCFVKPVKGSFSRLARRVDSLDELRAHLLRDEVREYLDGYLALFNELCRNYGKLEHDGRWFIAEELGHGAQVTFEGFASGELVESVGVVDSVFHAGTSSFARFDFPSRTPLAVQTRMHDIARRVVRELGLDQLAFNVEFFWDAHTDRITLIELNPRLCGQFGDLYAKVDGTSGYELALRVAVGDARPSERAQGLHRCASSLPLRVFDDVRVTRVPSPDDLAAARALFADTLIWNEVHAGQELGALRTLEDGLSVRYAVLNVGGDSLEDVQLHAASIRERLRYRFEP